jgi:two-component system, cell cycle sensor histidine kinase and response regulator CckA
MGQLPQTQILVVDDDASIRSLMRELLSRKGWKVLLAADGFEGVKTFQSRLTQVDLVITNAAMPHMDGCRASRLMRSLDAAVPIVLMSGHPLDVLDRNDNLAGVTTFLQKPFAITDLYALVQQLLPNDSDSSRSS